MIAPNTMIRPHDLQARFEQFGTDQQRHHAPGQEHGEREDQVQRTDILVVRGIQPATPAMRRPMSMGVTVDVLVARNYIVSNARHDNLLKRILRY
jgi:hypothetical protein